jgi:hypothetical protein
MSTGPKDKSDGGRSTFIARPAPCKQPASDIEPPDLGAVAKVVFLFFGEPLLVVPEFHFVNSVKSINNHRVQKEC